MRELLYDCYVGKDTKVFVKTVTTQKEAKESKELHPENFYKIRLKEVNAF